MLVKITIGFLAIILILFGSCTFAVVSAGVGSVYIQNEAVTLWLPLPMRFVDMALYVYPVDSLNDVRKNLMPIRDIAVASVHMLAESPDAILVEVNNPGESVQIEKNGEDIIIDIRSVTAGKVTIKLPVRSVERILRCHLAMTVLNFGASDSIEC